MKQTIENLQSQDSSFVLDKECSLPQLGRVHSGLAIGSLILVGGGAAFLGLFDRRPAVNGTSQQADEKPIVDYPDNHELQSLTPALAAQRIAVEPAAASMPSGEPDIDRSISAPVPETLHQLMDFAREDPFYLDQSAAGNFNILQIEAVRSALAEFPESKDSSWAESALAFHLDKSGIGYIDDHDLAKLNAHRFFPQDEQSAKLHERAELARKGYGEELTPDEQKELDYALHRRNTELKQRKTAR